MKIPDNLPHLKEFTEAFDAVPEQTILLATSALLEAFDGLGAFEVNLRLLARGGFMAGRVEATTRVNVRGVEMAFMQTGDKWPLELALVETPFRRLWSE